MKTTIALTAVSAMMLAAVACGKRDATAFAAAPVETTSGDLSAKASCSMRASLGTCSEYREGTSFGLEKSLCETYRGEFRSGSCPAAPLVGSCTIAGGEVKRYYRAGGAGERALTLAEARADCESDAVKGAFSTAVAHAGH
jgi:hypothetical protein